jgi:hypothetical protein
MIPLRYDVILDRFVGMEAFASLDPSLSPVLPQSQFGTVLTVLHSNNTQMHLHSLDLLNRAAAPRELLLWENFEHCAPAAQSCALYWFCVSAQGGARVARNYKIGDPQFLLQEELAVAPEVTLDKVAVAFGNDSIVVTGGTLPSENARATQDTLQYLVRNDSWQRLGNNTGLRVARSKHAAVVIDCRIYILGGVSDTGVVLASIEVFDVINDTWAIVTGAALPEARHSMAVSFNLRKLFVVGGFRVAEARSWEALVDVIHVWEFDRNRWFNLSARLPEPYHEGFLPVMAQHYEFDPCGNPDSQACLSQLTFCSLGAKEDAAPDRKSVV